MTLDTAADHAGGRYDYTEKIHAEAAAIFACVEVRGGFPGYRRHARVRTRAVRPYMETPPRTSTELNEKAFWPARNARLATGVPATEKPETRNDAIFDDPSNERSGR